MTRGFQNRVEKRSGGAVDQASGFSRLLLAFALAGVCTASADAQTTWEVTPYSVELWLAVDDRPDLPPRWRSRLPARLRDEFQAVFAAACRVEIQAAPPALEARMLNDLASITVDDVSRAAPRVDPLDKLFLVAITSRDSQYVARTRELDCRVQHLGRVEAGGVLSLDVLCHRIVQLLAEAFAPVVRIDRVQENTARTRLRAAGLINESDSILIPSAGDVLLPFQRRTSVTGAGGDVDSRGIDWTYLQVREVDGSSVGCEIVTGYRQPLRAKRSRRYQQLALRVRPAEKQSVVRLTSRDDPGQPLVGYEIHDRDRAGKFHLLGYTDWRGELRVQARADAPIRTLLVKHGARWLAELPLAPGLRSEVVAELVDDRKRVEAEGFLSGIQTALIDLVARRETLTAEIQRSLHAGDLPRAEQLVEEFRRLPTQNDFMRQIQQRQQTLDLSDPILRRQVDTLFVDTYRILGKYLDADRIRELEAALAAARQG